ncbi:MAG: patatin family protein [Oscillospiraceae bacterium]|nr:patatin family protein [Oscillospiraceae bacterium]
MEKEKTGLIVEGGGMKCAYSAGVLDGFLDGGISFGCCVGVSAGSANLASYLAGQRGRNLRFYTVHTEKGDFFGPKSFLKTGNLFGLQYIYGTLSNSGGEDPLDFQAVSDNPAQFQIVATNARTGTPVYFDKSDMRQDDYRPIMASSAIPAVCRPVEIGGSLYYDGGISNALPAGRALEMGCEKLVVILSKPGDYVKKPEGHRFWYSRLCRKYPETVKAIDRRHLMYREGQQILFDLEAQGKAFVFAPDNPPKMGTYSMNQQAERQLYDLGRLADFQARRQSLAAFLDGSTP